MLFLSKLRSHRVKNEKFVIVQCACINDEVTFKFCFVKRELHKKRTMLTSKYLDSKADTSIFFC